MGSTAETVTDLQRFFGHDQALLGMVAGDPLRKGEREHSGRIWDKKMRMRSFTYFILAIIGTFVIASRPGAETAESLVPSAKLTLVQAIVCEQVENLGPKNPAVVFPLELGEVTCFTAFDPVPEETVIYHQWFFRDQPSARVRLRVKPPRWSSFSRIQLRPGDAGPWRVEITDADGKIMALQRFSVVE